MSLYETIAELAGCKHLRGWKAIILAGAFRRRNDDGCQTTTLCRPTGGKAMGQLILLCADCGAEQTEDGGPWVRPHLVETLCTLSPAAAAGTDRPLRRVRPRRCRGRPARPRGSASAILCVDFQACRVALATHPDVRVLALHEHADRLFARAIEELRRCHGDVDPVTFAGLVAGLVQATGRS